MDDLPTKNKRRATRRKRNFVAKELRENKAFRPKVIEKKRTRKNIRVQEVEQWLEEEIKPTEEEKEIYQLVKEYQP